MKHSMAIHKYPLLKKKKKKKKIYITYIYIKYYLSDFGGLFMEKTKYQIV